MKYGLWYDFRKPPHVRQPWSQVYNDLLDQIAWAEEMGFESVWLSEHHFTADGYMPSIFPTLSAIGARTSRIRLGTAVCLAPLHHPLRLAEDAAVVDVLSGGRLELGLAPGYRTTEFSALGIPKYQRGKRTDETLEILRAAWTGGEINYTGEVFSFDGLVVQPTPVHPSGQIPIHIGGSGPKAASRAARYGCNFMPDVGTTKALHDKYRAELVANDRDPRSFEVTVNGCLYVCEDEKSGWEQVAGPLRYMYDQYAAWASEAGDALSSVSESDEIPIQDLCIVGTPSSVVKQLQIITRQLAPDRLIFWGRLPGMPIELANRSLELFVREVLPEVS